MDFIISAITDIGTTKSTNQDSFNVRVLSTPKGKMVFAVLCDGMGGLSKGEIASASLVNGYCKWVDNKLPILCEEGFDDVDIRSDWTEIAIEYNEKIKNYMVDRFNGNKIGMKPTGSSRRESFYLFVANIN